MEAIRFDNEGDTTTNKHVNSEYCQSPGIHSPQQACRRKASAASASGGSASGRSGGHPYTDNSNSRSSSHGPTAVVGYNQACRQQHVDKGPSQHNISEKEDRHTSSGINKQRISERAKSCTSAVADERRIAVPTSRHRYALTERQVQRQRGCCENNDTDAGSDTAEHQTSPRSPSIESSWVSAPALTEKPGRP